jgi:integrase/recombinase XerC
MKALATVNGAELAAADVAARIETFLKDLAASSRKAYAGDLAAFQRYLGASSPLDAVKHLLTLGPGGAFDLVTQYKGDLRDRGLSPATVNRRLATLRSAVKYFRAAGLIAWELGVKNLKSEPYRDTRGPGRDAVAAMLTYLKKRTGPKATRDAALIRLLYDRALRRGEVAALDVAAVDLDAPAVAVVGKGRLEPERLTLAEPTAEALRCWLAVRGDAPGPLFLNFDREGKGGRLTGGGIYAVVSALGRAVGVNTRPHGLRHTAITEAAKLRGAVGAAALGRHRDLNVTQRYLDNLADFGGEVTRAVAATVG